MATVSIEEKQFKTYPETYRTQIGVKEAFANIVLTKLGTISSVGWS